MQRLGLLLAALLLASPALPRGQAAEPLPPEKSAQLVVDVSAGLINAALSRSIDKTEPFQEVILNGRVTGTRRTIAKVRAELALDPDRGAVWVIVRGTNYARATAREDRVLAHISTVAAFEVGELLTIDANTLARTRGPALAKADVTLLCATGLNGDPDTFFAQMAPFAFRQQKQEVEDVVASLTAKQATQQFEEELAPALVTGRKTLSQGLTWAKEAGLEVESLRFSTGSAHLQARVRLAKAEEKEMSPRPPLPADVDLGVRVHESLLNQGARAALGGKTFTLTELISLVGQVTDAGFKDERKEPTKDRLQIIDKLLKAVTDKEPTVTFADADPLTARFTDDGFTLEARVTKISLGSLSLGGIRARASYRLENKDDGVFLLRQGPIQLLSASAAEDEKQLMTLAAPFHILVQAVADEIFKSRLSLIDLAPPSQLSRLSALKPAHAAASKEWLVVAWKLPPVK